MWFPSCRQLGQPVSIPYQTRCAINHPHRWRHKSIRIHWIPIWTLVPIVNRDYQYEPQWFWIHYYWHQMTIPLWMLPMLSDSEWNSTYPPSTMSNYQSLIAPWSLMSWVVVCRDWPHGMESLPCSQIQWNHLLISWLYLLGIISLLLLITHHSPFQLV